jgi:hypothetical protein
LLDSLFGSTYGTRLLVTQAVNRVPLPLRDIFGVRKSRNPKGIANFIKAYCAWFEQTGNQEFKDKAIALGDWLLTSHSAAHGMFAGKGLAWGYNFPWQSPSFLARRHSPNVIVTVFCGEAMLRLYQITKDTKYLDAADEVSRFILIELPVLEETADAKCIAYVPSGSRWSVININAVTAGFLAKLAYLHRNPTLMAHAKKMITWTLNAAGPEGQWNYTQPFSQSNIGPDNYHTGGILDGIFDYMLASQDQTPRAKYLKSLAYYEQNFFETSGAPKWRANQSYPHDVHGSAQGIITFTKARLFDSKHLSTAQNLLAWTLENLQDPATGRFYYQQKRFFTWKLDLMRWNNSWMMWAMADYLRAAASSGTNTQDRMAA